MIIVKLLGGLGNQMFQYACGRALAEKNQMDLAFDLSWFSSEIAILPNAVRKMSIDKFNISVQDISQSELRKFNDYLSLNQNSLSIRNFYRVSYFWLKRIVYGVMYKNYAVINEEMNFKYTPNLLNNQSDILYLNGYWQNELYFHEIKDLLLKQFTLKNENCSMDNELVNQMRAVNSVAIHIRRGDYANSAATQAYHGLLSLDYYKKAIEYITKDIPDPVVYLFSDDPVWCEENIKFPYKVNVVSNKTRSDAEELILMSKCKHQIIANSSFSWWAAWLNTYPQKIIIAPGNWLTGTVENPIPDGWIII